MSGLLSVLDSFDKSAYEQAFLTGIDLPEDGNFFPPGGFHINELGRKTHQRAVLVNGEIIGDQARIELANGLDVTVSRSFKEPLSKKLYDNLTLRKNASLIHGYIRGYKLSIEDFSSIPESTRQIIGLTLNSTAAKKPSQGSISTENVSVLNWAVKSLKCVPKWKESGPPVLNDPRISSLPRAEQEELIWIRRRDRKFSPDFINDGDGTVVAETRTFLFDNSTGIRLRRIFAEPLPHHRYEDFKHRQKRTLQREDSEPITGDLFEERRPISLLKTVDRFQFFPVFLLHPDYAYGQQPNNPLFPCVPSTRMAKIDPVVTEKVTLLLTGQFNRAMSKNPVYWTTDRVALALTMHEISKLRPHSAAFSKREFYDIAREVRAQDLKLQAQ